MTYDTNTPTPQSLRAEMAQLCEDLKDELENPPVMGEAMERQTVVLDRLLYAVMQRALKDDIEKGDFNYNHIDKALRIQKQSMDAYNSYHKRRYMEEVIQLSELRNKDLWQKIHSRRETGQQNALENLLKDQNPTPSPYLPNEQNE